MAAAKELELMAAEEAAERRRLEVVAAKDEWETIKARVKDLFLMCDRTARNTIRRKVFVEVRSFVRYFVCLVLNE